MLQLCRPLNALATRMLKTQTFTRPAQSGAVRATGRPRLATPTASHTERCIRMRSPREKDSMRARLWVGHQQGRSDWLSIRRSSRQSTGIGWVPPCKVRLTAIMPHLSAGRMRHTETMPSHPSESRQQLNQTIIHTTTMSLESPKSLTFTVLQVVVAIQLKTSQTTPTASTRGSSAEGTILVEWLTIVRSTETEAQRQLQPQTPTTSLYQRLDILQIGGEDIKMTMITITQLQKRQHGKLLTALATLSILSAIRLEAVSEPFHQPWLRDEHLIQALERSLKETC